MPGNWKYLLELQISQIVLEESVQASFHIGMNTTTILRTRTDEYLMLVHLCIFSHAAL